MCFVEHSELKSQAPRVETMSAQQLMGCFMDVVHRYGE